MSFLVQAITGLADEALSLVSPQNFLSHAHYVAKITLVAYRSIEDAIVYPRASLLGGVVNLTGARGPLALAAQVVLITHKVLVLKSDYLEVKKAFRRVIQAFDGSYPIPLQWLRSRKSYDPKIQNSLRITVLCHSPVFVTDATLRTELIAESVGRLFVRSMKLCFTFFELGSSIFIDPLMQNYASRSIFVNTIKIYEELQNNPIHLADELEEHSGFVDDFLERFGSPVKVAHLTYALKSTMTSISPHQTAISTIFRNVQATVQHGAFAMTNMTTGLPIAPLGLPDKAQTQPHHERNHHVSSRPLDPSRQSKSAKCRERYFSPPL